MRHFGWRHVRCASKYATITIFKGICQFILMAAIKVNYSRRQNVQRRRRRWRWWRQGRVPAQHRCRVGRAPNTSAARPCCGAGRQRPIRHNTLDFLGLASTLCVCLCVCVGGCEPCLIFLMILLQLTLFEFECDCVCVSQMSQNEYWLKT